jgi:ABC-type Fe3+-siderophore transport system permease subunit
MIPFLVSILLVVLIWYIVRTMLQAHPPPVQRIVDLVAVVFVVLLALRYFGLLV